MLMDDDVRRTNTGPELMTELNRLSFNQFKLQKNPTNETGSTVANSKIEEPLSNDNFVR